MKQSKLFPKTRKTSPKGAESINHQLLVRAGYIDQLMAGSWTLLPLGQRVVSKITQIIREEMNAIGAQEILMPLMHPKEIWNETGRWDSADEVMYKLKDTREREFALSFTHEEIFLDLVRKSLNSYQVLPIALYHFSTKFRNEARPRSGILRGREFLMKDLYSLHTDEKDFWKFYNSVAGAYKKAFKRMGFDAKYTESGGGVFTDNNTHEFQVLAKGGEDTIYYCDKCDFSENQEIFNGKKGDTCPKCTNGKIIEASSIEVGNIFPFGTYYTEKMGITFTDKNGKQVHPFFGSYGIGTTRVMGAWVETEAGHDDKGIIWPHAIAPFDVHLIELTSDKKQVTKNAHKVYEELTKTGVEVLWDDRDVSAGQKFSDADLIGMPVGLVVSEKTGDKVEYKKRNQDKTRIYSLSELRNIIST
jgi:prolyl-tRNA synthetase